MARLKGTKGDDTIIGKDGDDTIVPLLGQDKVDGGTGFDTLVVDYSALIRNYALSEITLGGDGSWSGVLRGEAPGALNSVTFQDVERVKLTSTQDADFVVVNLGALSPDKARLTLNGSDGDDTLNVTSGELTERLTLDASDGSKIKSNFAALFGWDNFAIDLGLAAGNEVKLGGGDDSILSIGGTDMIDGGAGADLWAGFYTAFDEDMTFFYTATTATASVSKGGAQLAEIRNVEDFRLQTGGGDDVVTAFGAAGNFNGGGGTDQFALNPYGGSSPIRYELYLANSSLVSGRAVSAGSGPLGFIDYETMVLGGGDGGDQFVFDADEFKLADGGFLLSMLAGEGYDTLRLNLSAQDAVSIGTNVTGSGSVEGLGASNVVTWTGVETLAATLGAGTDRIAFNVASKSLAVDGRAGVDTIDFTDATAGVSFDLGASGPTKVDGIRVSVTNVEGVVGSRYDDVLGGDTGANRLSGGRGADTLSGVGGADVFAYASKRESTGSGYDTIADFSHAQGDKIDLRAIDAKDGAGDPIRVNDAFTFIGDAAFGGVSGELREVGARGGGYFLYGDTNGDKVADLTIFVDGASWVSPADLIL